MKTLFSVVRPNGQSAKRSWFPFLSVPEITSTRTVDAISTGGMCANRFQPARIEIPVVFLENHGHLIQCF